jgi:voltage-dependent potassium channel beta subunit
MEYRHVGSSGLRISEISLGAWLTYGKSVDDDTAERIIRTAIDSGVNFIDIADIYAKGEAERVVGKAIAGMDRSHLVISSKVFWPMSEDINDRGLSRKHIMESIDDSLRRIGCDYLDIYYCHRFDSETPVEETVRAMSDLVSRGKIHYWGTSMWEAEQIEHAVAAAREWKGYLPVVEQPRYHMLDSRIEERIMPLCRRHGIGLTVWSPLGGGLLTGKYNDGIPPGTRGSETPWLEDVLTDDNLARVKKLNEIAASVDLTSAQLALAWVLRRPEVSCAIIGATKVEQLEENLKAVGVKLRPEMVDRIGAVLGVNE